MLARHAFAVRSVIASRHLNVKRRDVGVFADERERLPIIAGHGHDGDFGSFLCSVHAGI